MTIWVDGWQMQCCGEPFRLGSQVAWTLRAADPDGLEVSLIPETLERTTLGALAEGGRVNLEMDVVARYTERLMQGFTNEKETSDERR